MSTTYDRPQKNAVRSDTLWWDIPHRVSILDMPGPEALSARMMLDRGVTTRATRQLWVERRPEVASQLEAARKRLRLTKCTIAQTTLETLKLDRPLDLVNADMESSFTPNLGYWIESIPTHLLMPGCHFILTLTAWARKVPFFNDFKEFWPTDPEINLYVRTIWRQLNCDDIEEAETSFLLRCALHRFDIEQDMSVVYHDRAVGHHWGMVVNKLIVTRPRQGTPIYPSFKSIVDRTRNYIQS